MVMRSLRMASIVVGLSVALPASGQFVPPPCTGGVFGDVTCGGLFDAWIEQFAEDQITGGCGGGNYCPNGTVTRGQMAVFVEKAMRGTALWFPGDLGMSNTALGAKTLRLNTQSTSNTAIGYRALEELSFANGGTNYGGHNTAVGSFALNFVQPTSNANGINNTGVGWGVLSSNTTGYSNTAAGSAALFFVEEGFLNVGIGDRAGAREGQVTGYAGTAVTMVPIANGSYNTFIGSAGAAGEVSNCTAVGQDAYCDATDQVRLGNFFTNSIGGKVGWSTLSDARAKTDIEALDRGLPLILALKPVSYRLKGGNGRADMGFVAQDVEALLGDSFNVVDEGGGADKLLSLRYAELIAPLVKAVQEQQSQIEALRAEVAALQAAR